MLPSPSGLSAEQTGILRFFCSYFIEHEALARTASNLGQQFKSGAPWVFPGLEHDKTVVDSLLGCSHELMLLISMISDLAEEKQALQCTPVSSAEPGRSNQEGLKLRLQAIQARRNTIERCIYTLRQEMPPVPLHTNINNREVAAAMDELSNIAETRRLAALLYLYYRLDSLQPTDFRIVRLTNQILELIPRISMRTHAVLWQLYVVGTMGLGVPVGETGDADRKFVLERLVNLQSTRKLKNVGQAREAVVAAWKAKDLRGPDAEEGWNDMVAVRGRGISLC